MKLDREDAIKMQHPYVSTFHYSVNLSTSFMEKKLRNVMTDLVLRWKEACRESHLEVRRRRKAHIHGHELRACTHFRAATSSGEGYEEAELQHGAAFFVIQWVQRCRPEHFISCICKPSCLPCEHDYALRDANEDLSLLGRCS